MATSPSVKEIIVNPSSSTHPPDIPPDSSVASEPAGARVSQACVACRRKKVKCDGNQPCYNCGSRSQTCEYPGSKDNASASRRYAASFEARCQQMDALCRRLENLAGQLARSLDDLNHRGGVGSSSAQDIGNEDLLQAAHVLRSMPELIGSAHDGVHQSDQAPLEARPLSLPIEHSLITADRFEDDGSSASDFEEDEQIDPRLDGQRTSYRNVSGGESNRFGALVKDSYGRLRFVGGATNNMLIEAVKSLSPGGPVSTSTTPNESGVVQVAHEHKDLEIPLFVQGSVWPEMPYLPSPEQLSRPPKYVADLLIGLYFDQLHYTFPVLFKPHFMQRYRQMFRPGQSATAADNRRFLMVFFAVCACASSLLPPGPGGSGSSNERQFAGIEYYEKALLLYYAATGEASLERVQCLALLAMCAAGWNTLTQSWTLAGQAVRAAQDIGLHMSSRLVDRLSPTPSTIDPSEVLRQQISRRIWWSIYSLDRVTSICLGRPTAAHDQDCDCELPLDMSDEELETYYQQTSTASSAQLPRSLSPPTTGFIAFSRLCRIAGKIQQLHSPQRIRELASASPGRRRRFMRDVAAYDRSLGSWLEGLSDEIRFSANALGRGPSGSVNLTMCVIIFIVHAGSLLNLYRCLVGQPKQVGQQTDDSASVDAVSQCVSAARSCINAAELVRDLVPPSHHLAFCVHYLTLSGVVLLRMPAYQPSAETLQDVEKCVNLLKGLESLWSGASRGRAIIEQLLADYRVRSVGDGHQDGVSCAGEGPRHHLESKKRTFAEFDAYLPEGPEAEGLFWHHIPGSELFDFC